MSTLVQIKKEVPLTIFEEPILDMRMEGLFQNAEDKIKARFDEIVKYLNSTSKTVYNYDEISVLFRQYFQKAVINDAITNLFAGSQDYSMLNHILALLTEERLEGAIMGKPMIDAFSAFIRKTPCEDGFDAALHGSEILMLEQEFLGESIYTRLRDKVREDSTVYVDI